MVLKRLLGSPGAGGPSVDTALDPGTATPGGVLNGHVHLRGGSADSTVEHITLELLARIEAEPHDGASGDAVAFHEYAVGGNFRLAEGERRSVPFLLPLPWELPVTESHGRSLGITLGVRTELGVSGVRGWGDTEPLAVHCPPAQEAVLEAFDLLGFGFESAGLSLGHALGHRRGPGRQPPFRQAFAFSPAPRYAHRLDGIEVTFLAGPTGVEVALEADGRGGSSLADHDAPTRFTVGHHGVDRTDWKTEVDGWIRRLVEHRPSHGAHGPHLVRDTPTRRARIAPA